MVYNPPSRYARHCRVGHLLMFACDKVIKLTWSIRGQQGGSSVHDTDISGYAHSHPTGDIHDNSPSQLPSVSGPGFLVR